MALRFTLIGTPPVIPFLWTGPSDKRNPRLSRFAYHAVCRSEARVRVLAWPCLCDAQPHQACNSGAFWPACLRIAGESNVSGDRVAYARKFLSPVAVKRMCSLRVCIC